MRLLYLYLPQYGLFQNAEFNFDANERFFFNEADRSVCRTFKSSLPNAFFKTQIYDQPLVIDNISAVVGNNGAGKTTIFVAIKKILLDVATFEHILIYEKCDELYISHLLLPKKFPSQLDFDSFIQNFESLKEQSSDIVQNALQKLNEDEVQKDVPELAILIKKAKRKPRQELEAFIVRNNDGSVNIVENEHQQLNDFITRYRNNITMIQIKFKSDVSMKIHSRDLMGSNASDIDIIYHSNYFNTIDNWGIDFSGKDLSTSNLVRSGYEHFRNSSPNEKTYGARHQTDSYMFQELLWQSRFIKEWNTQKSPNELFSNLTLPCGIVISPNLNDWNRLQDRLDKKDHSGQYVTSSFIESSIYFYRELKNLEEQFNGQNDVPFFIKLVMAIYGNWLFYNIDSNFDSNKSSQYKRIFKKIYKVLKALHPASPSVIEYRRSDITNIFNRIFDDLTTFKFSAELDNIPVEDSCFLSISEIHDLFKLLDKYYSPNKLPYIRLNGNEANAHLYDFYTIMEKHDNIHSITSVLNFIFSPAPSSGEQALLSLYSRFYNLIHQEHAENAPIKDNLLVMFDETEITMHPDLQRQLIWNTIRFFEVFFKGKHIHLIFGTHSPIILSDIPIGNVNFLRRKDEGFLRKVDVNPSECLSDDLETFGANLSSLFRHSFFFNECFFGKFAQEKIDEIFESIKNTNTEDIDWKKLKDRVSLIGDPLIRSTFEYELKRKYDLSIATSDCDEVQYLEQLLKNAKDKKAQPK